MSRKNITYKFNVSYRLNFTGCRQKKQLRGNSKKTTNHFSHVPISQPMYTTKITIFLQIHIGLPQQQHYPESTISENTKRKAHGQRTITCETQINNKHTCG